MVSKLNKDALLEIGVENLPARFVPLALAQLQSSAVKLLSENRLACYSVRVFGTYKRLAVVMENVGSG